MISIEQALNHYIERLSPLATETIAVHQALHRVLACDVHSESDLPRFDQSAMDGYALRSEDTATAPVEIPVVNTSAAGHWPESALEANTAWRIYTGAPIPEGANTVIPQEHVKREGDTLKFEAPYPSGKNIRYRGEEISKGASLASSGQKVTPGLIASLRNGGTENVLVYKAPRISLLVTGDEIRSPGSQLNPGDIPDSNGPYIQNWLLANGYQAPEIIYVSDTQQDVASCLRVAAAEGDFIITTGGASVGDRDFIPATAKAIGFEEVFWKVAQKPGKPLFFGMRNDQAFLGLPGNPGAVLVGMEIHARTILNCLQGLADRLPQWRKGSLTAEIEADARRDRLIRLHVHQDVKGLCLIDPVGKQDSHMMSNLQQTNVLAHLPSRENNYQAGEFLNFIVLSE